MSEAMARSEHRPGRPHWHCTTCGDHWPCPPARRAMLAAVGSAGLSGLRAAMWAAQADAESDFAQLGTLARHGDLHDRFVGWVKLPAGGQER